jgi:seryl-tRNA synthetase
VNEKTMIRLVEMTNFLLVCAEGEETKDEMVARARRLLKELDIKYKVPT